MQVVSREVPIVAEITPDSEETRGLLQQAQAGDRLAFERLFERHRSYLVDVVAARLDPSIGARVDPSDVVQEAQLEAFRRLPDYLVRRPMPFRLWLRKTAQERLVMLRRRHLGAQGRSMRREVPLPERSSLLLARPFLAAGSTPSRQLGRNELARRVRQAVSRLPEADQEILLLRAYEGLSNQEVAYLFDIDPATASKRHGRAVLRLHRLLLEAGLSE
jgi:RNA polymerase sigma-70 factor (ECF subfamily)